jgi:hypothetical protein
VAGVLNTFNSNMNDPELVASTISYKLKDRFTLPIGLEDSLKNIKMESWSVENQNVIALDDESKINFLKYNLSQSKAGIILIRLPNSPWYYLHYITVLGYYQNNFYVYDSLVTKDSNNPKLTIDLNGKAPGNKSIPIHQLITIWNEGNILNYPKNYNLFVKPQTI